MANKKTNRQKKNVNSTEFMIDGWMDTYLRSSGNAARHIKHRIQRYSPRTVALKVLNRKINTTDNSDKIKLILLGLSMSREKYIHVFLVFYGTDTPVINNTHFLSIINDPPLNKQEELILAEYIAEHWDYDFRLLDFLSGGNLENALDGILRDSEGHVLKDKHLRALSRSKKHLNIIQPRIKELVDKGPKDRRKGWIPFLDLEKPENQEVIVKHYNLVEIYEQLGKGNPQYCECPYLDLKISMKLISGIPLTNDELIYLKEFIVAQVRTNDNIEESQTIIRLLEDTAKIDLSFAESLLIIIHHRTKLYTKYVFDILVRLKSNYAYHELINILVSTDNQNTRFTTVKTLLENYPEKKDILLSYIEQIDGEALKRFYLNTLTEFNLHEFNPPHSDISFPSAIPYRIISNTTTGNEINEILIEIAHAINADTFHAAVGFAYTSGLRLLSPVIDTIQKNHGSFELVVGSLQYAPKNLPTSKIDKRSIVYLNTLLNHAALKLFTYENAFFHGKFYLLANKHIAYVITGSSNISKHAFYNNCEFDLLFQINQLEDAENPLLKWFDSFKEKCTPIVSLNEALYTDFDWDSELSVFSEHFIRDFSRTDLEQKIASLEDSDTRNRLEMWVKHDPSRHFYIHNIPALQEYFVMEFKRHNLVVFESFERGNAFYVFSCDDFNQLIIDVSQMTKTQMQKYTAYKTRGIHTPNLILLQENIDRLFVE